MLRRYSSLKDKLIEIENSHPELFEVLYSQPVYKEIREQAADYDVAVGLFLRVCEWLSGFVTKNNGAANALKFMINDEFPGLIGNLYTREESEDNDNG